ncbi:unnamed protein product, partial [Ectocarpus sp. 4 AP-2014]
EASGGTDGEGSAAPDVESEASGGTDGEESGDTPRCYHDWSDDEFWGDDQNCLDQTDVESDVTDDDLGWSLVGKRGRVVSHGGGEVAKTLSKTRPVSSQVSHL